jgi:oligoendopeptidase F
MLHVRAAMPQTVVGDALLARAASPEERFRCLWGEAESAAAFLLNIPARFDFESGLYEVRLSLLSCTT